MCIRDRYMGNTEIGRKDSKRKEKSHTVISMVLKEDAHIELFITLLFGLRVFLALINTIITLYLYFCSSDLLRGFPLDADMVLSSKRFFLLEVIFQTILTVATINHEHLLLFGVNLLIALYNYYLFHQREYLDKAYLPLERSVIETRHTRHLFKLALYICLFFFLLYEFANVAARFVVTHILT
eukprot:TRINITY_DN13325_c0_g1_i1.p1 TRINITY_DN13325_c0_g1~~TRINITY_DN13325_c0_g1_i1.p1  ORF type:complete len:183 (+),score=38.53 TRINITY_DN13325_c0_g1_i1:63-611(+)